MKEFDNKVFSETLIKYRKRKKLSQEGLAAHIGVSQSSITSYEKGNQLPSVPILFEISKILEVSIDVLIKGEQPESISITGNADSAKESVFTLQIESLSQQLSLVKTIENDLRREINTLRAYTSTLEKNNASLEKSLARYEDSEGNQIDRRTG